MLRRIRGGGEGHAAKSRHDIFIIFLMYYKGSAGLISCGINDLGIDIRNDQLFCICGDSLKDRFGFLHSPVLVTELSIEGPLIIGFGELSGNAGGLLGTGVLHRDIQFLPG